LSITPKIFLNLLENENPCGEFYQNWFVGEFKVQNYYVSSSHRNDKKL